MAQWILMLATKPDRLGLLSGYQCGGENQLPQLSIDLHMHARAMGIPSKTEFDKRSSKMS